MRVVDSSPAPEAPRRLVVELGRKTAEDLAWLVEADNLNKTTVVNRAVQVLRRVMEAQHHGGSVTIEDPVRGKTETFVIV
ncbi:hypothetical protein [Geodermatophilus sabuli]|uniref:hypothetical protein n=1 Tax=Geodermatophilus sabuli TaxID=1564158 RepID=UPI00117B99F7|nr:hypothetical protein [Geodermatophilus sabuli]MBB3082940.1 hypothetical protein [Geodermatophilus sabuli]